MAVNISIVVGNPKAHSRTRQVAEDAMRAIYGDAAEITVVELADYASGLFDWGAADVAEMSKQVGASDVIVLATPTYKATYTGLLKAFLDRYGADQLLDTVAYLVMTGGDKTHALAPDTGLRPLLVELGASMPTHALYAVMDDSPLEPQIEAWAEGAKRSLAAAARAAAAVV